MGAIRLPSLRSAVGDEHFKGLLYRGGVMRGKLFSMIFSLLRNLLWLTAHASGDLFVYVSEC